MPGLLGDFILLFAFLLLVPLLPGVADATVKGEAPPGARVIHDLVYGKAGVRELLLDLYLPEEETSSRLPVIVFIHGGGWRMGSKDRCPAADMAAKGYAVASVGYRLSGEATFPAQIGDCKAAVRWLREQADAYGLDSERFGAWGSSAGGHLSALLGTSGDVDALEGENGSPGFSSRIQAVCDYFGPTDFLQMDAAGGQMTHTSGDSPESLLIGGAIEDHHDRVSAANPITYVTPDDPPFLIVHGDKDPLVLHHQSELLFNALSTVGVEATFVTVEGGGHGFRTPKVRELAEAFFKRHLKGVDIPAPATEKRFSIPDGPPPAVAWKDAVTTPPQLMQYRTFHSAVAGEEVSYLLYLPPGYETSSRRYPVVYWLHGLGGTQRESFGFVSRLHQGIQAGSAPEMIVVGVNGRAMSMYADSFDGKVPMESVIVKDLVPHVDATYRTIDDRRARAAEGFSMGGFGALYLGSRYADVFGVVSSLAGALHNEESLPGGGTPGDWSVPPERRKRVFDAVYGSKDYFREHSPWLWVEKQADRLRRDSVIRLIVGDQDPVRGPSGRMHDLLGRLEIQHGYEVVAGVGHNPGKLMNQLSVDPLAFYSKTFDALFGSE